jgi:hypothetical protein
MAEPNSESPVGGAASDMNGVVEECFSLSYSKLFSELIEALNRISYHIYL